MSVSGSGRSRCRRCHSNLLIDEQKKNKSRKCFHFLFSCCIFFMLLSACLIAALVIIGKHFYYNDVHFQIGSGSEGREGTMDIAAPKRNITRLPRNAYAFAYDLTIHPHYVQNEFTDFNGVVNISVRVDKNANATEVVLHSHLLTIDKVSMQTENGARVDVHEFRLKPTDELLYVYPGRDLIADEVYFLIIEYHGKMRNSVGFYHSSYFDKETKIKRSIATTKFEPTYARQAFPCFDEPNFKANFTLHIIKPKDSEYIALSNMPVKSETEVSNGVKVTFEESVKMSTYLACWVVSDFKWTQDVITSKFKDIPYRVFATPAQVEKTEYATMVGKKVMQFYLDYFQIPFPLPKLDMLAIPDYSSGATEHWGIVTFRETALLFDNKISSELNRQRVATVVAHELAHSWFGNLVTMDWWNDLWLNEGFASYIEYKGVEYVHPDWQMMDQYLKADLHTVLKIDATLASHPIIQSVNSPDEITSLFDTISYSKGASILRMIENAIGEENFRVGVTNYLKKYAFANAITQNLIEEFQAVATDTNIDLMEFLQTWTVQMGYPVVTVQKIEGGFRLTQKRFLTDPEKKDNTTTPYKYRWTIPITYFSDEDAEPQLVWFKHQDDYIDVSIVGDYKYVKFNARQVGYYRVNYELDVWETLIENIPNLNVSDRTHLIEESFRLAEASILPYSTALNLSKYLGEELEYVPWATATTLFAQLKMYLAASPVFGDFKEYVLGLCQAALANYSWNETLNDSHLTKLGRSLVIRLSCSMGDQGCLGETRRRLRMYLYDGIKPSPDMKGVIYQYGMVQATEEDWEKMWNLYIDETDAGERASLLIGLTHVHDITLILRLLDLAKDDKYIRKQDYPTCIANIAGNPIGNPIVWIYFRENWNNLVERFGLNDRYLHNMIPTITKRFITQTQKDEVLAFFANNPEVGAGANARKGAIESIDNNIGWLRRNIKSVEDWIVENKS